jgi:predicted lipoprotein with Yx(FWY)xxD motif
MRRTTFLTTVLAGGVLVLGGCGSDGGDAGTDAGSPPDDGSAAPAGDALLATADTDLGTVVVDAEGLTVYVFDKDTPGSGESACSDQCLENWPPVVADSEEPAVDGVTGEIGTITRDDGTMQVTLEGAPLYYWQGDSGPGDTTGQGVQGVWWVVTPDGAKVTAAPAADDGY